MRSLDYDRCVVDRLEMNETKALVKMFYMIFQIISMIFLVVTLFYSRKSNYNCHVGCLLNNQVN